MGEKSDERPLDAMTDTSSVSAMSLKSGSDDGTVESTSEGTKEFNDWRLPSVGRMLMRTGHRIVKLDPNLSVTMAEKDRPFRLRMTALADGLKKTRIQIGKLGLKRARTDPF